MSMKMKGSFHFLRKYFQQDKDLTDQEYRLLMIYRGSCDWDPKHINFGTSDISLREIKKDLLPGWSLGKLSEVRKKMVENGGLRQTSRTRFGIKNPEIFYKKRVRDIELVVQSAERNVHSTEQAVRITELNDDFKKMKAGLFLTKNVYSTERAADPKEPLKKEKELLKNNEDSSLLPIWRDSERIKQLRERLSNKDGGNSP